ncbi:hypothetical protein [Thermomonospora catenispora]|uniref:hypothetical protein n=1 Tax=Thermomonospora catenispora TaxID=2493090 RepID=UPI0011211444|nr:hypothetical protein [Thermomonospora catenispora]TNY37941.1 hypothetical protein EIO00_05005 [Thermomonospora catenispora]
MANWTRHTARAVVCAALVPAFTVVGGALAHADAGAPSRAPLEVCGFARSFDGLVGLICKGRIDGPDALQVDLRPLTEAPRSALGAQRARRGDRDWHEVVRTPLTDPVRGVQDTIMGLGAMLSDLGRQAGGARPAQSAGSQAGKSSGRARPEKASGTPRPRAGHGGGQARPGTGQTGGTKARSGKGTVGGGKKARSGKGKIGGVKARSGKGTVGGEARPAA